MPETTHAPKDDPWLREALTRPAGPAGGDASEPGAASAPAAPRPEAAPEAPEAAETPADAPEPEEAVPIRPRAVRRLAVQALYVLGTEADATRERLLEALDEPYDDEDEPEGDAENPAAAKEAAVELALAAWAGHEAADAAVVAQVPAWPTLRQPPVDRALLRLAHHELVTQRAPFAVVINEAVELAKAFGEDRTPGFVNAVLDALARGATPREADPDADGPVRTSTADHPTSGAVARRAKRERFEEKKKAMAAKIGPKHPRPEPRTEPAGSVEPDRSAEPDERPAPDEPTDADPWAAAAAAKRRES